MSLKTPPASFLALDPQEQRDLLQCFRGICALYGYDGFFKLQQAHVVLVGTGGVGSWAAENLCRSGIGSLSLIDNDVVEITNSNRQLHTLHSTVDQTKVSVLGKRLLDINPYLKLDTFTTKLIAQYNVQSSLEQALHVDQGYLISQRRPLQDLLDPDKLAHQCYDKGQALFVIDAIDDLKAKAEMLDLLHRASIPCITAGGAGGRIHPELLRISDIAEAQGDQLIKRLRTELRRNFAYPAATNGRKQHFKMLCTWSNEEPQLSKNQQLDYELANAPELPQFGAAMSVTAVAGLLLSSVIIRWIVGSSYQAK